MVSSVCPGSYQTKTPQDSPTRTLCIDPAKDYSTPLNVETSVEYDLPAHIYPPKGSEPILMIHPGFVSAVPRARSGAVITPTATVATSGATRTLAPLQQHRCPFTSSSSSLTSRSRCSCGNPNCNLFSDISATVQNIRNIQNVRDTKSVANVRNEQRVVLRNVTKRNDSSINNTMLLQNQLQEMSNTAFVGPPHLDRNSAVRLQQPSTVTRGTSTTASTAYTTQPFVWGAGERCRGACCYPRPATIAPPQAEFVAPGLPPSLLASTPTRGTAGGSPKIKGARSRRGLAFTSNVHLPEYMTMSGSRTARVTGGTASAYTSIPRVPPTSMGGILVATPAPPMAHQNMTTTLTTSLDLASLAHSLTPKSLYPTQQQQQGRSLQPSSMGLTASMGTSVTSSMAPASISNNTSMIPSGGSTSLLLEKVVDLSRDSGCSTGGDYPLDYTSDITRGLVDSGFCTPVDTPMSDDFLTDMLSLPSWKETLSSYTPVIDSGPTSSSLLSRTSSHPQYLPQPLWNLVY